MPQTVLRLLSFLPLWLLVAAAIILFYEGVPLGPIRYIPYVGDALAGIVDGRVDRAARSAREDGAAQERILWEEARLKILAQQEAKRAADQAAIDALEADLIEQQERADEAEAALEEAAAGADNSNIALPKHLGEALNRVGR